MPIRVLIVDDSLFIRQMFSKFLMSDEGIEVVGTASDPYDAREKIKVTNPDVITLDVEMPKMDGITFLDKIMKLRPTPVLMVSSLTERGAEVTLKAMELGAVDYIAKPKDLVNGLEAVRDMLIAKVKIAARATVTGHSSVMPSETANLLPYNGNPNKHLIAIGASTGGVEAIRDVVRLMPKNTPPIIITQHMPETFTASFAKRLNNLSALSVHEAKEGQTLETGNVYIAPGGRHLMLRKQGTTYRCHLDNSPEVSGHKPSVDVMFESVAKEVSDRHIVSAMLTGMGKDGAQGMLTLREKGAATLGQSEASCVVYGMPRAAKEAGAVQEEHPLALMAAKILEKCS